MIEIRFIKDFEDLNNKGEVILKHKKGEIVKVSKENSKQFIKLGYAEFIDEPKEKKSYYEIQLDALNSIEKLHDKKEYIKKIDFNQLIEKDTDAETIKSINVFNDFLNEGVLKENKGEEGKGKIPIELPGNGVLVSEFADKLAPVFKNKNLLFYREDLSSIVEIKNNEFKEVKPIRFITLIEKYFIPWVKRFNKSGGSFEIDHSIPQLISNAVLASPNFEEGILKIERIFPVQIPIIYQNKLTFPQKGYDERFNSWTLPTSPNIRTDMSLKDAKTILYKIYNEFCFQSNQDYVNAIAGLLTPNLRGLFSNFNVRTPFKAYLANRERAGKDFCAGINGIVYEGRYIEETPISTGEYKSSGTNDELRKKIMSAFIQGRRGLHFANNKGRLNNAVLEGVLTNPIYSDRILGSNKMGTFSNEMDFSCSGNIGITLTPDLINRTIFIRLFLDIEDANARNFKNPLLHEWVENNRGEILSALFTLIKNWINKGMKPGTLPFASYPEWARICGGIMEAADLGNPCVKDKIANQGISLDPESEEMKILFETMYEKYPEEYVDKKIIELLIRGSNTDNTLMPFIDWEKKSDQTKFGMKLNKNVGRLFSDIRLIVENQNIRTTRWKYKFTKEKSTFNKEEIFKIKEDNNLDGHLGHLRHLLPSPANSYLKRNITIGENVAKVAKVATNLDKIEFLDDELIKINPEYANLSSEEQQKAQEILKMTKKEDEKIK